MGEKTIEELRNEYREPNLERLLEKVFNYAFSAGRLYTFRNKSVPYEKLMVDMGVSFYQFEKIPNEHGISIMDILKKYELTEAKAQ